MQRRFVLLFIAATAIPVSAQTVDTGYSVGTWSGFRQAAVTHTFDDNDANQYAKAVPLFNEFGFRLTLYAITGATSWRPINWAEVAAAAADGHEIGAHTVTHTDMATLDEVGQRAELAGSVDAIRQHVAGLQVLTLAYPYCVRGLESVVAEFFISARTCQGVIERTTPNNFLAVSSMVVGTEGSIKTAADLNTRVKQAASSNGWAVFLMHGIDGDGGWSPVPSTELRLHVLWLSLHRDEYWVDTFANVTRYIRERNAASVIETAATATSITVEIVDGLDDSIYSVPITIRRVLPADWTAATATQAGVEIAARTVVEGTTRLVQFDAVPDGGEVVLTASEGTTVENAGSAVSGPASLDVYPNPVGSHAHFEFRVSGHGEVRIHVFDMLGRLLETVVDGPLSPGRHLAEWNTGALRPGAYVVRLTADGHFSSRVVTVRRSR